MKILFVYKEDYPWDIRVEKITATLVEHGHDVVLLCRNLKGSPRHEKTGGTLIERLPGYRKPFWNKVLTFPFFFNPIWLYQIFNHARRGCDLIIVRDLPLVLAGILAAKILGCKTIFDMAECYPEMYRSSLEYDGESGIGRLLKNPQMAEVVERLSIRLCDHVFVMIDESLARLRTKGVPVEKVSIVSNTPRLATMPTVPDESGSHKTLALLYVGFVTQLRGLDNVLRGLRRYYDTTVGRPRVTLTVVGVGDALNELALLSSELGLQEFVRLEGWLDFEKVKSLYLTSSVGVLPYHYCSHWETTIPNKIFDYMAVGLPVLATKVGPIRRIIEEWECGLVFDDNDPDSFVRALEELAKPDNYNRMRCHGIAGVRRALNWSVDGGRMMAVVDSLATKPWSR